MANLDIWSYYLENYLCRFIPYDPEFICHRNLTLSDIHHKFFNAPKTWESLIPPDSQFISLVKLIHQCTEVTNEIHVINKLPTVTWNELVKYFEEKLKDGTSSQVCVCLCVCMCVCMYVCIIMCSYNNVIIILSLVQ